MELTNLGYLHISFVIFVVYFIIKNIYDRFWDGKKIFLAGLLMFLVATFPSVMVKNMETLSYLVLALQIVLFAGNLGGFLISISPKIDNKPFFDNYQNIVGLSTRTDDEIRTIVDKLITKAKKTDDIALIPLAVNLLAKCRPKLCEQIKTRLEGDPELVILLLASKSLRDRYNKAKKQTKAS